MNVTKTVSAIAASLVLPGAVFVIYTDLNIHQRLFVERFGCGCHPFFNTNHLSLGISAAVLCLSALLWWPASSGFSQRCRVGFRMVSGVASLWFLRFFMMHNGWL
ncbi:hypothetical protein LBMAG57_16580 [Verrucomicrobiota bacterium]|nr:hypothetical protein LBMAG57_16580 [Verrucomicrobiota bacterium]